MGYWENRGQACDLAQVPLNDVRFYSDGVVPKTCFMDGGHLGLVQEYLSPDTINPDTLYRIDMIPIDAASVVPVGMEASAEVMHFYFGHTMPNGAENVHRYQYVVYPELWPGISMWVYPDGHKQRIAFSCAPGSDPDMIKFKYVGQEEASLDGEGNAMLDANVGELMMPAPLIYKVVGNSTVNLPEQEPATLEPIADVAGQEAVAYSVPEVAADPTKPTVLLFSEENPMVQRGMGGGSDLCWSTYYGGSRQEWIAESAKDWKNNYYVVGHTKSAPNTFPGGPGGPNIYLSGTYYGTISQFDDEEKLIWTSMLGGGVNVLTYAEAIAVKDFNSPEIYIGGNLYNNVPNFFTYLPPGSSAYFDGTPSVPGSNGFICKFNEFGLLRWSTYWGDKTQIRSMAISERRLLITGATFTVLPTPSTAAPAPATSWPPQPFSSTNGDAYVYGFDPMDRTNWCCYLGGSAGDIGYNIKVQGNSIYVQGQTQSTNFPTLQKPGAFNDNTFNGGTDLFIARFNYQYTCSWSTYFGGTGTEFGVFNNLAISPLNGDVYIVGEVLDPSASSTGFPLLPHANGLAYFDGTLGAGRTGFIAHFKGGTDALRWCTYFGKYDLVHFIEAVTVDESGQVYIAGTTASNDLPVMSSNMFFWNQPSITPNDGLDNDGFIALFKPVDDVMEWCTYFGGNAGNLWERIQTLTTKEGALFAGGITSKYTNLASYFPLQYNGIPGSFYDDIFGDLVIPVYDGFLTKFCTPWSDMVVGDEKSLPPTETPREPFDVWWADGNLNVHGVGEGELVQCFGADGRLALVGRLQPRYLNGPQVLEVGGLATGIYVLVASSGERSKFLVP